MTAVRCFVAVPLPAELVHALVALQRQLAKDFPAVRWTRPETLHLTLGFFGEQPEEALDKIAEIMLSVGSLSAPFTVRTSGVAVFPNRRHVRGLWLGLEASPPLIDLQRALLNGWRRAGIAIDSAPFRPHLTLGRWRHPQPLTGALPESCTAAAPLRWRVQRMILYESRLKATGAEHLSRRVAILGESRGAFAK